jgi:4-hydroxy-3-polyprenylbenzoate decarboxylase
VLFVSIRKEYALQARKVVQALWGIGREAIAKTIVVVDDDCDVSDETEVRLRLAANCHPSRDVFFGDGPGDVDDHAAPVAGVGSRMGIDATRKTPEEGHSREWPERLAADPATRERVARRWSEYGLGEAGPS